MNKVELIVKGCKDYNASYQKALYNLYASELMGICIRYACDRDEAKDILQEGFIKIYDNIGQYNAEGSFEGWLKRVMVNTAINYIRKNRKNLFISIDVLDDEGSESNMLQELSGEEESQYMHDYTHEELLTAINQLNDEFRIVFNMYFIENYSHKEIASILSIKEDTSRTRLLRARKQIRKNLLKLNKNTKVKL